eukprot:CAMPEP_0206253496 /NCGR_PEP_ID=MMETSP0047_2-20121206/23182_1 /ASSEMBLY_ACC=CAM_ASM_000192 /TAXON_ID=195065 /ORGANISM="Chroomonas mesostigmatica_cf, Strain CCMP1168" /LENGTH=131 /DNA_ID=CAMNT_0053679707 /DNA_START=49 /DNA_END=444 /DNA_ORIENTATION=-
MKRERVFELAKGFRGKANNCFRVAHQKVEKALQKQYIGRKELKRDMRALWITRLNAASREHGLKYNDFMHGLGLANIELDRKVMSDIAVTEPATFGEIVARARAALMAKHAPNGVQAPGGMAAAQAHAHGQ